MARTAPNPFMLVYDPDLDMTDELLLELTLYFQSQIGILHLIVELGQIDIAQRSHCTHPMWH